MFDPLGRLRPLGRAGEKGSQMLGGGFIFSPLDQQERQPVVGSTGLLVDFEGLAIVPNGVVVLVGLREGDGHVLQDPKIGRVIAESQPIRSEGGGEVSLTLERQSLIEIVEPLRTKLGVGAAPEPFPESHIQRQDIASRTRWQRLFYKACAGPGLEIVCERKGWDAVSTAAHRDVLEVDWPFFGELCRGLALRIVGSYDPEIVVGVAKAGVIPGAVVASILQRDFASMAVTRERAKARPTLVTAPPPSVQGRRILVVDETCDSGDTLKLALNVLRQHHPAEIRSAVSFKTGEYTPDFHALATKSVIILPWDREVIADGELVVRPEYLPYLGS